jgi:hypothetical protein
MGTLHCPGSLVGRMSVLNLLRDSSANSELALDVAHRPCMLLQGPVPVGCVCLVHVCTLVSEQRRVNSYFITDTAPR